MLAPIDIARLEERRQALGTAEVATESERVAGGWMAFAGPGSWANQACALGLDGPVTDDELDRLVEFYSSRGVEPKLEVCPFAHLTLVAGLAARGFQLREFENVLARPLGADEALPDRAVDAGDAHVEISWVDPGDEAVADTFVEVSTSGFRPAGEPMDPVFRDVTHRVVKHPRCDSFLVTWNGRPVGGGGMESTTEIACLFGTSVIPEYRRRGIQGALIQRRLQRARERGCSLAVIHSAPGIPTERNATRLGFSVAYTKVVMAMPGSGLRPSP